MYSERCHFITVINRTVFGSFCIYKYFMGFDGVLEWILNKALGSQATPRASLCIIHSREILLSEIQTESCYKPGFLKGTADKRNNRISIFWLLSTAVANSVSYPASAPVTLVFGFFWDKVRSFSFHEHLAERTVHGAFRILTVTLWPTFKKTRSINYDICKIHASLTLEWI